MSLKIQMVEEIDPYFKALIYGPQGGGKTAWVANNAPKPLWLDFEKSTDTLRAMGFKGIPIIEVGPDSNPAEIVTTTKKEVASGNHETIVFDTISSSQLFELGYRSDKAGHDTALIQDFRLSKDYWSELFFWLQHQPIHVILIAHERTLWEGDLANRKKIGIVPAVTPALHDATTQLVSNVLRLERKKSGMGANATYVREMLCHSDGLYIAKNRCNVEETRISEPTWATFMKG